MQCRRARRAVRPDIKPSASPLEGSTPPRPRRRRERNASACAVRCRSTPPHLERDSWPLPQKGVRHLIWVDIIRRANGFSGFLLRTKHACGRSTCHPRTLWGFGTPTVAHGHLREEKRGFQPREARIRPARARQRHAAGTADRSMKNCARSSPLVTDYRATCSAEHWRRVDPAGDRAQPRTPSQMHARRDEATPDVILRPDRCAACTRERRFASA